MCPFEILSIWDCIHKGLCPFGIVFIWDGVTSGLSSFPLRIVSIYDRSHSRLCPIRDRIHSGLYPFEIVYQTVIFKTVNSYTTYGISKVVNYPKSKTENRSLLCTFTNAGGKVNYSTLNQV